MRDLTRVYGQMCVRSRPHPLRTKSSPSVWRDPNPTLSSSGTLIAHKLALFTIWQQISRDAANTHTRAERLPELKCRSVRMWRLHDQTGFTPELSWRECVFSHTVTKRLQNNDLLILQLIVWLIITLLYFFITKVLHGAGRSVFMLFFFFTQKEATFGCLWCLKALMTAAHFCCITCCHSSGCLGSEVGVAWARQPADTCVLYCFMENDKGHAFFRNTVCWYHTWQASHGKD